MAKARAYFNEIDLYCAEWLYNLQKENLIAPGDIDTRPIQDVCPNDLKGYSQHHFFAGIGGWSRALRLSDWPDHREVWTGSCPCQPFSLAGKRGGFADDRHLWPYFRYLIAIGRPAIVFGEQVASAAEWLGLVRGDLEAMDYAVGAMPVEAASAGADHLRDRFWFVGHDPSDGRSEGRAEHELRGGWPAAPGDGGMEHAAQQQQHGRRLAGPFGRDEHSDDGSGRLANARRGRRAGSGEGQDQFEGRGEIVGAGSTSNLADYYYSRSQGRPLSAERPDQRFAGTNGLANPDFACEVDGHEQRSRQFGGTGGDPQARDSSVTPNAFISTDERSITRAEQRLVPSIGGEDASFNWVLGADGKARRVKPGVRLLAHGVPNRVGKLRGFGNAIDPRPAAAFIQSVKDIIDRT